ncbi:MAG: hypothetical protein JWO52_6787 [Gammaproteobacteria bacterium]|nr:hypothetical protein [Gammaproteobacteria bacterium]
MHETYDCLTRRQGGCRVPQTFICVRPEAPNPAPSAACIGELHELPSVPVQGCRSSLAANAGIELHCCSGLIPRFIRPREFGHPSSGVCRHSHATAEVFYLRQLSPKGSDSPSEVSGNGS